MFFFRMIMHFWPLLAKKIQNRSWLTRFTGKSQIGWYFNSDFSILRPSWHKGNSLIDKQRKTFNLFIFKLHFIAQVVLRTSLALYTKAVLHYRIFLIYDKCRVFFVWKYWRKKREEKTPENIAKLLVLWYLYFFCNGL